MIDLRLQIGVGLKHCKVFTDMLDKHPALIRSPAFHQPKRRISSETSTPPEASSRLQSEKYRLYCALGPSRKIRPKEPSRQGRISPASPSRRSIKASAPKARIFSRAFLHLAGSFSMAVTFAPVLRCRAMDVRPSAAPISRMRSAPFERHRRSSSVSSVQVGSRPFFASSRRARRRIFASISNISR